MNSLITLAVMAIGGMLSIMVAYMRGRVTGAKLERAEQAQAEKKASDIADQIDNDIGAVPPKDLREEAKRWSRG